MKKIKTTLRKLVTSIAVTAALAAPAVEALASDKKYKFNLATEAGDQDSNLGKAIKSWSEKVAHKSDGRIKVNVFYQGQLGGPQEMFDQLVKGNIHMMLTWPHTSYNEKLGVVHLPYLVLGWDDAKKAYAQDGWLSNIVDPLFADMGLKYFGPYPEGFGGIATKGRYATSFEGAKGIKVRSQPVFPMPQTMQAMGFQAVPIDWAEVYTAIQTGVVDGDSSNVIFWDYEYFRDQLNYFVHSKHNFASNALLMNHDTWSELDAEDRKIIESAAQEVIAQQFEVAKKEDDYWIAKAQEAGIEYIVPSSEETLAWIERVRKDVWPKVETAVGKEIMDNIRSNASLPQ